MRKLREWFRWHSVYAHIAAPIWLRIPEKHRWTIVYRFDKSRRRCWSDLVSDALAYREDDPCDTHVPPVQITSDGAARCKSVCDWSHPDHTGEHPCACYCGKFQFVAPNGSIERRQIGDFT